MFCPAVTQIRGRSLQWRRPASKSAPWRALSPTGSPTEVPRIKFESGQNTWTIWNKEGTKTILSPIINVPANAIVPGGALRWGVSSRIDTDNDTVAYAWSCQDGDCYPSTATHSCYQITFFKEARPDWLSWAGASTTFSTRRARGTPGNAPRSTRRIRR
jgi:hypothetical protein